MSENRDSPSARLPLAVAGLVAFFVIVIAFNLPFSPGLTLAVGAWWCIVVIAEDAPVFEKVALLARMKALFQGSGWRPVISVLAIGLLLAVPAEFARHNRFAKPFLFLGAPAAFLGAFGVLTGAGKRSSEAWHEFHHWFSTKVQRLREALRPAIVKVALSELDALQKEIAPRIDRYMIERAVRMTGAYLVKDWETNALSSERRSIEWHQRAAYRSVRDAIIAHNGKEARAIAKSSRSFGEALLTILRERHRDVVLTAHYPSDSFYGVIEPMTRAEFFSILNDMLTERGAQTAEQAAVAVAELKTAIAEQVAAAHAA
jgi:hypothetical protein